MSIYLLNANYLVTCGMFKPYLIFSMFIYLINFGLFNLRSIGYQHVDTERGSTLKEVSK
jgi:hypothetical protein